MDFQFQYNGEQKISCEKKSFNTDIDPTKERIWESTSAEIAVFDDEGIVPVGGDDQVIGWLSPDEVAKYIAMVSSATNKNEIKTKIKELGEAK